MLRVDFHCHSCYSKDSLTSLESLIEACRKKRVDRVVVTDHNTIEGTLRAYELAPDLVIPGEEIMTREGELLAAFVSVQVPSGLPALEAIAALRSQGAFISVSHPFDWLRSGHWAELALIKIAPLVDAIETFNARCIWPGFNARAKAFADKYNLPGTAGSDAHTPAEIGKALLLLPNFHDSDSLRATISQGTTLAGLSSAWVHTASRFARWRKSVLSHRSK